MADVTALLKQLDVRPHMGSHIDIHKIFANITNKQLRAELKQDLQYMLLTTSKRARRGSSGPDGASWSTPDNPAENVTKYLILFPLDSANFDLKYEMVIGLALLLQLPYSDVLKLLAAGGGAHVMDETLISALAHDVGQVVTTQRPKPKAVKTESVDVAAADEVGTPKARKRKAKPAETVSKKERRERPAKIKVVRETKTREKAKERKAKTAATLEIRQPAQTQARLDHPIQGRKTVEKRRMRTKQKVAPWALHKPLTLPGARNCTAVLNMHCAALPGYSSVVRNAYHPSVHQMTAPPPPFQTHYDLARPTDDDLTPAEPIDNSTQPEPYLVVMPIPEANGTIPEACPTSPSGTPAPPPPNQGLFLDRPAPAGAPVGDYIGHVLPADELTRLIAEEKVTALGARCRHVLYIPELALCVDAHTRGNEARFVRTSATPNSVIKLVFVAQRLHFQIHTTHALSVGAEITIGLQHSWVRTGWDTIVPKPSQWSVALKGVSSTPAALGHHLLLRPDAGRALSRQAIARAIESKDMDQYPDYIPHVTPDPADLALADLLREDIERLKATAKKSPTTPHPSGKGKAKEVRASPSPLPSPPMGSPLPARTPVAGGLLAAQVGANVSLGAVIVWPEVGSDPNPSTTEAVPEQMERPVDLSVGQPGVAMGAWIPAHLAPPSPHPAKRARIIESVVLRRPKGVDMIECIVRDHRDVVVNDRRCETRRAVVT